MTTPANKRLVLLKELGDNGPMAAYINNSGPASSLRHQTPPWLQTEEDLLACMAYVEHELRDPLGAMSNCVALLSALHLTKEQQTVVSTLERQLQHTLSLVSSMGDLIVGRDTLQLAPISFKEIWDATLEVEGRSISTRSQVLESSMPPQAVMLSADRHRLVQALCNVLGNASKYSPEGSKIHVDATLDGDNLKLVIRDHGMGILPEVLPHVFEAFYRSPRAAATGKVGFGLGLSIAHKVIRAHGGDLTLASDGPGSGAEAVVLLPKLA
ncbi:MAG: Sensor histidine kinase WalK [Fimbriimonadaceae bacterium]|nr:Sensor histidine kinase WalK [Fimbriimonadaceae bacterium]